jgi:glutathione synthase/RimK-type ligase-like ATP-grasp enzyme
MNILVLGNSKDVHAAHLKNALTQAGVKAEYLDTALFPTQISLSWQPDTQDGYLTLSDGCQLNLSDIHSIFWRNFSGVQIPPINDPYQQRIAFNDAMSALRSLMQGTSIHWINSWQAYQFHKEKPLQLSKAKQIGINIPATLITNNPEAIAQFAKSYEKAIFKPVYGGAHVQLLTEAHLQPERLKLALCLSPITIQEYIPGTNIRTYVIGNSIYSAEIRSQSLDFREDREAQLIPVELPESVQRQCQAIARAFFLEWTAIDWRLTPNGEYIFLEANPSPMFLHFEHQTGFPITRELVCLLMS